MKQEINPKIYNLIGDMCHGYNPSGRFNIREYPPQSGFTDTPVKVSKVWNTVFCDHPTLAPTTPRLIDELLCNEFKRK